MESDDDEPRSGGPSDLTTEIVGSTGPRRPTLPMPVVDATSPVVVTMVASPQPRSPRRVTATFPMVPERDSDRGDRIAVLPNPHAANAMNDATPLAHDALPPWPRWDAPTGFVWPVMTGGDLLRQVALDDARFVAEPAPIGVAPWACPIIAESAGHRLETSRARRFAGVDEARAALVRLARRKAQLGELLPGGTVLAIRDAPDGSFWLWTVTPRTTHLRAMMSLAIEHGDARELAAALCWFAWGAAEAAALARAKRLVLDVDPARFALEGGAVIYVSDAIEEGAELPAIGASLIRCFDDYEAHGAALAALEGAIEGALSAKLTRADAAAIGLESSVRASAPRSARAHTAKERLLRVVHALR